jgi:FkbM family methyltransferase
MKKNNHKKLLTAGNISIKQCKHGIMAYGRYDKYVGRSFDLYGEFSDEEFQILETFAKNGFVLDVGANIGALTVPFARVAKSVVAFEPQPNVADILTTNVCLNGLTNVDVLRMAVGDKTGVVSMPVSDLSVIGNYGGTGLYGVQGDTTLLRTQDVQIVAVDDLNLGPIDVIKMDVEGHELEALKGMERHILASKPILYVEADRFDKAPALLAYIRSLGYEILMHKPTLYERKNYYDESENVFGNIVSINAFCYVPEKHTTVTKEFKVQYKLQPC